MFAPLIIADLDIVTATLLFVNRIKMRYPLSYLLTNSKWVLEKKSSRCRFFETPTGDEIKRIAEVDLEESPSRYRQRQKLHCETGDNETEPEVEINYIKSRRRRADWKAPVPECYLAGDLLSERNDTSGHNVTGSETIAQRPQITDSTRRCLPVALFKQTLFENASESVT